MLRFICFQDTNSKSNISKNGTPENDQFDENSEDALTALPLFCIGKCVIKY